MRKELRNGKESRERKESGEENGSKEDLSHGFLNCTLALNHPAIGKSSRKPRLEMAVPSHGGTVTRFSLLCSVRTYCLHRFSHHQEVFEVEPESSISAFGNSSGQGRKMLNLFGLADP